MPVGQSLSLIANGVVDPRVLTPLKAEVKVVPMSTVTFDVEQARWVTEMDALSMMLSPASEPNIYVPRSWGVTAVPAEMRPVFTI